MATAAAQPGETAEQASSPSPLGFEELAASHRAGVWRYLRFLGASDSEADDLTQETFLAVQCKPFEQRSPSATSAYLRTVARHQFLMLRRKLKRQTNVEELDLADEVWQQHHADDNGEAYLAAMRECLETLTGRARTAIDQRYRDNRSRAEIAAELEMTEDGVKSLLRRTRDLLRQCVEKRLQE